jgi:hypothetical protein
MALFRSTPQIFTLYDTTLTQAVSTTFVSSSKTITLPAGTYQYEGWVGGDTVSTTGGVSLQLSTTLSGSGCFVIRVSRGNGYFSLSTDQGASRRADSNAQLHASINMDAGATAKNVSGWINGTLIIATAQTFGFQIAQRTANDAVNPAIMSTGCYIKYTKIA